LRHILEENAQTYIKTFGSMIRAVVLTVLMKTLQCGTLQNGFRSYYCPDCSEVHRIRFSCKTRLCSKCGERANEGFADRFVRRMLPVTHRHIVFTIPDRLWKMFHGDKKLLQGLSVAVNKTIMQTMELYVGRKIVAACMAVIHTFGRDLKVNCHIHALVTEGGLDRFGRWVRFTYFPFEKKGRIHKTMNEIWRDNVLELLAEHLPDTKYNRIFLQGFRDRYHEGFYIYGPAKNRIKSNRSLRKKAKYITRYVKHPVISDSRITRYDGTEVEFWYEKPSTRERHYVVMPVMDFICAVLMHVPEKNFRAVMYYGLYSPNYPQKEEYQAVFSILGDAADPLKLNWREDSYLRTGRDPLRCKRCGGELLLVSVVYRKDRRFVVCYYLTMDDRMPLQYPGDELELITNP
jgi:hypothetical protein